MPSRNFCDLCDEVISSDDPYFDLEITARVKDAYGNSPYYHTEIKNQRTDIETSHGMVCKTCIVKILKKRDELGDKG